MMFTSLLPKALLMALDAQRRFVPVSVQVAWLIAEWIVAAWIFGFIEEDEMTRMLQGLRKQVVMSGLLGKTEPSRN